MKKILIVLFVFLALFSQAQLTNVNDFKVANATTAFGRNIPIGTKVYNVATGDYWVATAGITSTSTLTTASASFTRLNGAGTVTNIATGLGLTGGPITTTGTVTLDTASSVVLSRQRAANTYQPKGNYLTSFTEADPIFGAHTVKNISNGTGFLKNTAGTWSYDNSTYSLSSHTHTGTYEPAITAGTTAQFWRGDKSWQTLNTTAVTEGTNLYYTEARVNANANVTAAYTNRITSLTTTGSSGAATLLSNTLNIPNYTLSGLGGQPQLNGTGFIKASGTTITYDNSTYLTTEVDGSVTNEIQDLSGSGATLSGYTLSLTGDGTPVTLPNEADGSTTNEIQTITNSSDATSHTVTLSNSGGSVQLVEGSNITLTTSGTGSAGVVTIASTGGGVTDHGALTGLADDDHTQYTKADGTRAYTGIVSYSSHPTFTTDAQIVDKKYVDDAITAGGGYTDEQAQDATGAMVTGNTETGIEVTYDDANAKLNFVATDASTTNELNSSMSWIDGTNTIGVTDAGGTQSVVITGFLESEVDGSVSNEGSLSVTAGGASSSVLHSNTSGSTDVTINVAGINTISETGSSITITATEVDGSTTNEIEVTDEAFSAANFNGGTTTATSQDDFYDYVHIADTDDDGLPNKADLASAGFVKSDASGNLSVDGNTYLTTEVDGSVSNEGSLTVAAGTATTSIINSNTSGQTGVTLEAGTNITISETGNTITIAASGGGGTPGGSSGQVQYNSSGTFAGDADLTFDGNILTTKVQKLVVQNGSKSANWTHDAAAGDLGAYQVNLAASTISIHNLASGMQGTIFLNFVTTTPTSITVNTFSDAGSTGLTEVVLGGNPTLALNKSTSVTYTCASDGTNTYVYLVYGQQP